MLTDDQARDAVIVALDCSAQKALETARLLSGHARWLKVGMTLFYAAGPSIVETFKSQGYQVFLDLKLFDIPHQIEGAAASAAACGADLLSIHGLGGAAMAQAARRGVESQAAEKPARCNLVAITVLTSMSEEDASSVGIETPIAQEVSRLASLACSNGTDGIVCSPQEAQAMRELLGPQARIVCPGVRPQGAQMGDQSRVDTPLATLKAGASQIVVGRPIMNAPDPLKAFEDIVLELQGQ